MRSWVIGCTAKGIHTRERKRQLRYPPMIETSTSGAQSPLQAGDIFLVPLHDGTYALGLLARKTRSAIALGYFFSARVKPSEEIDALDLRPATAIYISRFSVMGLRDQSWEVIGRLSPWNRVDWPVPVFGHVPAHDRDHPVLRSYDDRTLKFVHEERCSMNRATVAPPDGLAGSVFIEKRLAKLLS